MNKLNLLLLAGAAALASCASEDVINSGDINPSTGGQAMSFGVLTGNHSRAAEAMETVGHTDFGVFAYKGASYAAGEVMDNYQVRYSADDPGEGKNTTWAESKWYYEGISPQVLKYWDYSFESHSFVAYTPFSLSNVNFSGTTTYDLEIINLKSFWTKAERDDKEAMWCQTIVNKGQYGQEVALTFNHLNAVIKLAFRSKVPGYAVRLINLVPAADIVPGITEVKYGVQLTPATQAQSELAIGWDPNSGAAQPGLTQLHADVAKIKVSDVFNTPAVSTTVTNSSSANLVFNFAQTAVNNAEFLISNTPDYRPLYSQYFALPLTAGAYIGDYATGYTLHVSYVLVPNDGAATTTVYDARVFIPADKCQWEYGKAYTYNFTITPASTGVTDPNTIIYNGEDDSIGSPYVDPTDPRVSGNALLPIVFDGVTVTDYAAEANSDHDIN